MFVKSLKKKKGKLNSRFPKNNLFLKIKHSYYLSKINNKSLNFNFMISQINARGWITIYVSEPGEKGDPGQPAEFYDLMPLTEKAIVIIDSDNPNGKLIVQLQYNIRHITGDTIEVVNSSASGYHIRFRTNISATYYSLSNGVSNPSYTNASFLPNYHTASSKPDYLIVELCKGSSHTVINQKIVPVVFNDSLLFDINTSLNQITSQVQGHSANIEDLLNRSVGGRNFVRNTSDSWSDWITLRDVYNQTIQFGECYLPADKEVGDYFTSQIIIEWSSVEETHNGTFKIATQSSVDNAWTAPSFWDNHLVNYTAEPEDGIVRYVHTYQVQDSNKNAVLMKPSIRIDYASGAFRYKCVKIEKGNTPTDWSKNPDDIDSSILSVNNSISQWQQTMDSISSTVNTHTTNINTINGQISSLQNDVTRVEQKADSITSTVDKLFVETLFENQIQGGSFFSLSDGQSGQSISYDSASNTYKMQCTSTAQDIDYSNNYNSTNFRIDKGKYQLSFYVDLSAPTVQYNCVVDIRNASGTVLKEKVIVDNSYSPYTNGTMVVDSFEVPQDDCRFQLYFESVYNDRQIAASWWISVRDLKITMQTQAASILEQKADSITSTVYEYRRDIAALSDDNLNLFKRSVYDGSELSSGNKWEFVSSGLNYIFNNWTSFNRVFNDGYCNWETKSNGTTYVYSPYLYLTANQAYTLNCTFSYEDGKNTLQLCRFSNAARARAISSIASTTTLQTSPMTLDYGSDVVTFTPTTTGYYRIRFGNKVSNYDEDNDYNVEIQYVRLYKGTYTAEQFKKWSENNSKVYSQIQQTGHSISLKVHDDLLETGIDIENQTIDVYADKFTIYNNSDEQIFGTDRDGNVDITGTIRAKSLYREICFFVDGGNYHFPNDTENRKWYYCYDLSYMEDNDDAEGWVDHNNFSIGGYYAWPNEKAPHYGTAPLGFVNCTYDADIIMMLPRANGTWRDSVAVILPSPNDFAGKIVKILTTRSVTTVASGAAIKIGCVEDQKMALGFYASSNGTSYSAVSVVDTITISPYYNVELMSIGGKWIVMDITSKNYSITGN